MYNIVVIQRYDMNYHKISFFVAYFNIFMFVFYFYINKKITLFVKIVKSL